MFVDLPAIRRVERRRSEDAGYGGARRSLDEKRDCQQTGDDDAGAQATRRC
jgi:hypothetical protein